VFSRISVNIDYSSDDGENGEPTPSSVLCHLTGG
jgi:hypothetical protein